MKFIKFLAIIVCLLIYGNVLTALEVGEKAPPLDVSKWVTGPPVTINKTDEKIYVIFFWATWSSISPNLMNYVLRENLIFADDDVVFVGISKESPKRIKNFLKKYPDINFSIGRDNHAETYAGYMQGTKGVPMFFIIGRDKKLIWKGSPFEANRVLVRVLGGTFDAEIQKKIVKYRERIQKAAQMLDNKEKLYYAKKILKLDPTDRIAMNIIIDNYILEKEEVKAIDFIRSSRKQALENKYIQRELFFLELSIVRAMNNALGKEKLAELVKSYSKVFSGDSSALNSLAIVVSRDVPLSIIPLSEILDVSKKALKLAQDSHQNKKNLSSCLQSLARIYYYIGRLKKAISTQKEAIELIDNKSKRNDKETALLMKTYYKEALRLKLEN